MIEVNKNTLASALPALGKLICRTSPLMLCKSIKIESENGKLKLSTCGLSEEVSYELETESNEEFCCMVGLDEFRDAVKSGRNKTVGLTYEAGTLLVGDRYLITVKDKLLSRIGRILERCEDLRSGSSWKIKIHILIKSYYGAV